MREEVESEHHKLSDQSWDFGKGYCVQLAHKLTHQLPKLVVSDSLRHDQDLVVYYGSLEQDELHYHQ